MSRPTNLMFRTPNEASPEFRMTNVNREGKRLNYTTNNSATSLPM